jgi:hypothetical protein
VVCVVLGCVPAPAQAKRRIKRPTLAQINVASTRLVYLPDQEGGNYHDAFAVVDNNSRYTAVLGGQFSIYNAAGQLVKTVSARQVAIAPDASAPMLSTVINLREPAPDGYAKLYPRITDYSRPTTPSTSLSDVAYHPAPADSTNGRGCTITGVVHNTLIRSATFVGVSAVAVSGGTIVTGDTDYIDDMLPGLDATFEIRPVSPAECPATVDEVLAHVDDPAAKP